METKNGKVKMVVPEGIGAITVSGVPLEIEDGFTWVPMTMVQDVLPHGLTIDETPKVDEAAEAEALAAQAQEVLAKKGN